MTPKPREVYLARFPFSDLTSSKKRPVLVLSKERFNHETKGCIVAALTTNDAAPYSVRIMDKDLEFGSLFGGRSAVQYGDIFSASDTLLEKKIMRLKQGCFEEICRKFKALI